jgi:hypothetical protein
MAALLSQSNSQRDQEPPSKKSKKGDDGVTISTSCSYLYQLPTLRLRILIETIHAPFDTVTTGKWEVEPLMRLIWLLSGMEANLQVMPIFAMSGFGIGLSGLVLQIVRFVKGDARIGGGAFFGNGIGIPIWRGGLLCRELLF